jgi:hypothetical protein
MINLTNKIFGRLDVIGESGRSNGGQIMWLCQCECGNEIVVRSQSLRKGRTRSCGCLQKEINSKDKSTHSMSGTRTYRIFQSMMDRCYNKNNKKYEDYGGRGIGVCKRWTGHNGFINFITDMGECPDNLTIERQNNNADYSVENCRWANRTDQNNNKRDSKWWFVDGIRYVSSVEASKATNIPARTIRYRCNKKLAGFWTEPKYP